MLIIKPATDENQSTLKSYEQTNVPKAGEAANTLQSSAAITQISAGEQQIEIAKTPPEEEKTTLAQTEGDLFSVDTNSIPPSLKAADQWVHWKSGQEKATKTPWVADAEKLASSTDPSTWRPFDIAAPSLSSDRGLGFVLHPPSEYCFVDLDYVRNPQTKEIKPWATRLVNALSSYTEVSPSGTGLHILGRVKNKVPPTGLKRGESSCTRKADTRP